MAVASTTHREHGPLAQDGGFELPLTNMVMAIALMSAGTGALRFGPHLSKSWTRAAFLGGAALAAGSIAYMLRNSSAPVEKVADSTEEPDEVSVNHSMASS
jgi:hypothetical protein